MRWMRWGCDTHCFAEGDFFFFFFAELGEGVLDLLLVADGLADRNCKGASSVCAIMHVYVCMYVGMYVCDVM